MTLIQALINSGQAETLEEAKDIYYEMVDRLNHGEDPEEILYDHGLEPDYIFELLYSGTGSL